MNDGHKKNLAELARGIEKTYENAQELYNEAEILRTNGSLSRSYLLHQISLEECGKIDIIGAWAISVFSGRGFDQGKLSKAMRSHKAKNYANSYLATQSPDEREARERGDMKASIEAFRRFQKKFHAESNAAKNASLYVDFKDNCFVSPSDEISDELVSGIAAVNRYFLDLTGPKVRVMQRMISDDRSLGNTIDWFFDQVKKLDNRGEDIEAQLQGLMDKLFEKYRSAQNEGGQSA